MPAGASCLPTSAMTRDSTKQLSLAARRVALGLVIAGVAAAAAVVCVPSPVPKLRAKYTCTVVTDSEGRLVRHFLGDGEERCLYVPLSEVSRNLVEATLAVEDKRFRSHFGVDPLALVRAVFCNLRRQRVVSGASTITMQLARLIEPRPRRLWAKAIEAFRALQLEWGLSKDEILEAYLNFAPYGGNLVGVEAAARCYFGRGAGELDLAQAALLAGLPQAPSRLRPDRWPGRARGRRDAVLHQMWRAGVISRRARAGAAAEPVAVTRRGLPFRAAHFAELVRSRYGAKGQRAVTTLEATVQDAAEDLLRSGVARLREQGVRSGSMVVIRNRTGRVAAMVGSPDFFADADQGQVNGAVALRSPGSALKPFTYALAFERGVCGPDTVLADVPVRFGAYVPENFDRRYHGPVPAADALARSLNVPAVALLHAVGVEELERLLSRLGVSPRGRAGASAGLALTLGASEVRLLDLTNAYACLARLGEYRPYALLLHERAQPTRLLGEASCYLVAESLLRTRPPHDDNPPAAVKTGTSYGHHDAWAVGFNPEWTVGVWVGNFSGRASRALVGATAAAPIVRAMFRRLCGGRAGPWYERPDSIGERVVCTASGMGAGPHCSATRRGLFIRGVSPTAQCTVHRTEKVDDATGQVLCGRCVAGRAYHEEVAERWPVALGHWLRSHGRLAATRPHFAQCARAADTAGPRILSPHHGQCYGRAGGPCASSRLLLRAAASCRRVCWFVDGRLYREAEASAHVFWPLAPGPHRFTCVDDAGRGASVRVVVR